MLAGLARCELKIPSRHLLVNNITISGVVEVRRRSGVFAVNFEQISHILVFQ